ncbi:MAG: glutamate--tRNA ligase [Sphingomonadales bacterium]|jgi:glutamyl-tRNA synthetase
MTETAPIVRFAPSPTGKLHVGNIRTALLNWLFARKHGGTFILRLDDTDIERSKEEYVEAIRADLAWLGMDVDDEFRQSERFDKYNAAAEKLKAMGRLYPCYESAEELEVKRKLQLARHQPPVYDRAALNLSDEDRAKLEAEGRKPHWRFKLDETVRVEWNDLIRGETSIDMSSLSDPILIREDGSYLYMLPSVVDDIDRNITHVVRGEDHVVNTAVQIQMIEALDGERANYAHAALLSGKEGQGLSKRLGSTGVEHFKADGIEAITLLAKLARLGTSDPVEPFTSLEPLIEGFDFSRFGRATAKFDEDELRALNAKILHQTGFEAVKGRLPAGMDEAAWVAVRANIERLSDVDGWWKVIQGPITPVVEDEVYLAKAAELLPEGAWDETSWKSWTSAVKEATGAKGKSLFLPLRLALTGEGHGPEMAVLLPLIGRERVLKRLAGEAA